MKDTVSEAVRQEALTEAIKSGGSVRQGLSSTMLWTLALRRTLCCCVPGSRFPHLATAKTLAQTTKRFKTTKYNFQILMIIARRGEKKLDKGSIYLNDTHLDIAYSSAQQRYLHKQVTVVSQIIPETVCSESICLTTSHG